METEAEVNAQPIHDIDGASLVGIRHVNGNKTLNTGRHSVHCRAFADTTLVDGFWIRLLEFIQPVHASHLRGSSDPLERYRGMLTQQRSTERKRHAGHGLKVEEWSTFTSGTLVERLFRDRQGGVSGIRNPQAKADSRYPYVSADQCTYNSPHPLLSIISGQPRPAKGCTYSGQSGSPLRAEAHARR